MMYKWLIKKPEPTKDLDTQPQTGKLFSLKFLITSLPNKLLQFYKNFELYFSRRCILFNTEHVFGLTLSTRVKSVVSLINARDKTTKFVIYVWEELGNLQRPLPAIHIVTVIKPLHPSCPFILILHRKNSMQNFYMHHHF